MSKLLTTFKKYIFNTFRHVPTVHVSTKRKTLGRRIVISVLVSLIALEHVLVPFAYAEQNTPTPKAQKEQFKTLTTDTNLEGVDPYIGEGRGVKSIIPAITDLSVSNDSATVAVPARVHRLAKEDYRPNEEIKVVIENGINKKFKTELIDAVGQKVALETTEKETGAAKVITINQPSSFRPGKYTLRISDGKGGVSEQDFSWGVLAINPDKSIYAPQENADLAIAVLDEGGNMVCDAQVELQITDPNNKVTSLSTDNGKVLINPECKSHDFTLKPDYETNYQVGGIGEYQMHLKAQTKNGAYEISDSFAVQAAAPFDVKRVTATRIYPPNTYPVTMEITANQDFEGTVTESVPASFRIAKPGSQVLTEAQQVDKDVNASDSGILAPEPQLPNAPEVAGIQTSSVLPFSTVNNLANINGGERAVFGATIPGLGMPFNGPFPVTQEFGENLVHMDDAGLYETFGMHGHDGIDFGMPIGTTIQSVDNGTVVQAGPGGYGTTVVVKHSWGYSYYGHLSEVKVKVGDQVIRGSAIALSGNSGITTGPHLHFSIKPDKNDEDNGYYGKVDPAYYLGMKQSAGVVLAAATKVQPESYTTPVSTDIQVLTWKINVKKGDKIKIGYNYLAPRISPQFYTLGPATFTDTSGKEVFHEIRKWQIASDALEYKFKRGTFIKADCTAPCTQSVSGVGFKGKAVIFEWTRQTTETAVQDQSTGMGFATSSSQQRAVNFWADDGDATSDTGKIRSDTKAIVFQTNSGGVIAQAEFVSFDADGFTINWTTNNASGYILHYTVLGGADVSNAKAGTFTLTTGTGSLGVTDPGFKPDFLMVMGTANDAVDTNTAHAAMNVGYAAGSAEEGAITINSESTRATSDTWGQQRTDATVLLLTPTTGAQDAIADFTSFDTNGFTLNKSDGPAANTDIFYLAVQGGQYDVGALTQPSAAGESTVTTSFRPVGVSLASENATASTGISAHSALSLGGASKDSTVGWCNDKTGITCTAPGTTTNDTNSATNWCNDGTGITCNTSWTSRKKITFNNTASTTNLTNYPVLVKLNSSRIDYSKTQNSGQDIRFVDPSDPTTVLPHEVESWNESGDSYVWVKVPQIDANSNSDYIWMYYNNSSAASGQDATNVWDTPYKSIWHLAENPGGTAPQMQDSTANNYDGTANGSMNIADQVSGKINGSLDFDGVNDYIDGGNITQINSVTQVTVSTWIKRRSANSLVIAMKQDGSGNNGVGIEAWSDGNIYFDVSNGSSTYGYIASNDTEWHLLTLVYDGTQTGNTNRLKGYLDGTAQTLTFGGTIPATTTSNTTSFKIGTDLSSNFTNGFIDETRISTGTRSADLVKADYLTQTDNMNSFGQEITYGQTTSTSNGWSERIKISINNDDSTETLTDFPVLVKLNSSRISYSKTQNSGQDIRFVDPSDPSTVLSHEIESWNESGDSYVWVKIPQLKAGNNNAIYMYYNNPSAPDGQDTANVWSNNYKAVYHLDEQSGTTNTDSTLNANNGTKRAATEPNPVTSGPIGQAQDFDNSNDYVRASDSNSLDLSSAGTITAWINRDGTGGTWDSIIAKGDSNSGSAHNYYLDIDPSDNTVKFGLGNGTSSISLGSSQSLTSTVNDYFIAGTWGAASMLLYINGSQDASSSLGINPAGNAATFRLGEFGGSVDYFNGLIDEVRISSVTRSQSWIKAEYWSGTDAMNTFSSSESYSSLGQSIYQSTLWSSDTDNLATEENSNMSTSTSKALQLYTSPTGVNPPSSVAGAAEITSFDANGFNINWTTSDGTAREVLYWTVGSVTASQEDYRWYKNANSITPGEALEDENTSTIIAKNKPTARLRASMSVGGNGLNASAQGFKLQYAAAGAEASVGATNDWCNDTTGVTCIAPGPQTQQTVTQTDWCNDASGITCDTNWQYRRKITINNSASGSTLTDFPVLVKLDSTRIDYSKTQSDGDDLRFVADGAPTVVLPHEIDGTWSNSGTNYVWVKVTLASGSSTGAIYMYYGNNAATSGQDVTNVWSSNNYQSVWHLGESGDNVGNDYIDSTSTANNAQGGGGTAGRVPAQSAGQIGNAQDFDGSDDLLTTSQGGAYNLSNAFTIDLWVNADDCGDTGGAGTMFENFADAGEFYVCSTNNRALGFWVNSPGNDTYTVASVFNFSTWVHVAVTHNGSGTYNYYVNGVLQTLSDGTGSVNNASSPSTKVGIIGADEASLASSYNFDGDMDDLRVSNTVRTADWLRAEYLTGTDAMNSFGSEQTYQTTTSSNGGWDMRRKITFNNADSTENLIDFPVLIKLDSSRIDYSKTQNAGQDIRFVDPANPTVVLPHEIETWNESGTSYVWVKVPQVDSGSTSDYIWMYYDNPTVADGQDTTNVWDSNFKMVQHLDQNPAVTCASTYEFCDSTSNGTNGDNGSGMPAGDQVTGKIGGAINFDNDYINVPDGTALDTLSTNMTVSMWVKADLLNATYSRIIERNTHPSQQWFIEGDGAFPGQILWNSGNNSGTTAPISQFKWYYITMVTTPTSGSIYINGVLDQTLGGTGSIGTVGDVHIGAASDSSSDWDGIIDEVQLSNTARSVSWIVASYKSGNDTFASFGDESPYTTGGQVSSGWTDVADIWCNDNTGITCNTNWTTRKRITINNQASSTTLTSFPVLVKLDSTRIDYSKTQNSGQDLRFVDPADPNTVLPHEIERWDESGTSYVWVQVPQLDAKSSTDSIWMYYGNAAISDGQAASSVWDSNFRMVQHLNQNPGGSAPQMTDSTSVGQNGTSNGSMTSSNQITGQIDGALSFDGSNDNIDFGNTTALVSSSNFTISAWMKRTTTSSSGWVIKSDASFLNNVGLEYDSTNVYYHVAPTGTNAYGTLAFTDTNWHLITLQYDGSQTGNANRLKGYIDGIPQTLSFSGTIPSSSTSNTSAFKLNQQASAFANSSIDEVRISNTTRTADWIKTDYLSQTDQLNTFGNEETQSSAVWRFKDNTSVSDGTTITSAVLGTSTSGNQMSYQESNPTFLIPTALGVGEKREFDFSLDGSRASNRRTYYFRLVNADGTPMTNYTKYPSITVGVPNEKLMRGGKWFNYKKEQNVSF